MTSVWVLEWAVGEGAEIRWFPVPGQHWCPNETTARRVWSRQLKTDLDDVIEYRLTEYAQKEVPS